MTILPRRRAVALGAAAAVLVALAAYALLAARGPEPPANGAARLVPSNALAYVHVSTDPDRDEDARLWRLAGRFGFARALGTRAAERVAPTLPPADLARQVRDWLGDELAVALLDTPGTTAQGVLLAAVRDPKRALGFLVRAGATGTVRHRGVRVLRFRDVSGAVFGSWLAVGAEAGVRAAIDRHAGAGRALADLPTFIAAMRELPPGRVVDAYAAPPGLRRLLSVRDDLAGIVARLIDDVSVTGVSAALGPDERGARAVVRALRDEPPGRARTAWRGALLDRHVPADAAAFVGVASLADAVAALGRAAGGEGRVLAGAERLVRDLTRAGGVDARADLLDPLDGEAALTVGASAAAPVLALVARTRSPDRTRDALSRLHAPLAERFAPPGAGPGQVPTIEQTAIAGAPAVVLGLSPALRPAYSLVERLLFAATDPGGLAAARAPRASLAETDAFERLVGKPKGAITALAWADLRQLLALGERTGLTADRTFQAVREDLGKIQAAGAVVTREEKATTAELIVEIP